MTSQEHADKLLAGFHAARDGLPLQDDPDPDFEDGYRCHPRTAAQSVDAIMASASFKAAAARAAAHEPVKPHLPAPSVDDATAAHITAGMIRVIQGGTW
jgi:hypothetical protein